MRGTLKRSGRLRYGLVPDWIVDFDGYRHSYEAVLRAMAAAAGSDYECAASRESIMASAKVKVTTYTWAIRWFLKVGLIENRPRQPGDLGPRRHFLWRRVNGGAVSVPMSSETAANPNASARARARFEAREGARASAAAIKEAQARVPDSEEEEDNVPSTSTVSSTVHAGASGDTGTGRDDALRGEGEGTKTPPPDPGVIAAAEAKLAAVKARYRGRHLTHPVGRAEYLAALEELERLRPPEPAESRPRAEARPVSQGLPVAAPRASPQLAEVLEAAQALARGRADPATREAIARRAMAALGDPGADPEATVEMWADALRLVPDRMLALLRRAPRKGKPAPWLSKALGRILPAARRSVEARASPT